MTGSNTGIGLQAAKMLYDAGAHVVMACRSERQACPRRCRRRPPR